MSDHFILGLPRLTAIEHTSMSMDTIGASNRNNMNKKTTPSTKLKRKRLKTLKSNFYREMKLSGCVLCFLPTTAVVKFFHWWSYSLVPKLFQFQNVHFYLFYSSFLYIMVTYVIMVNNLHNKWLTKNNRDIKQSFSTVSESRGLKKNCELSSFGS